MLKGVIILNSHSHALEECPHLACFLAGRLLEDQPELCHRPPGLWQNVGTASFPTFFPDVSSLFSLQTLLHIVCGLRSLKSYRLYNIYWFTSSWKIELLYPSVFTTKFVSFNFSRRQQNPSAGCCLFRNLCGGPATPLREWGIFTSSDPRWFVEVVKVSCGAGEEFAYMYVCVYR